MTRRDSESVVARRATARRLADAGIPTTEIAGQLGVSLGTVYRYLPASGRGYQRRGYPRHVRDEALRLHDAGIPTTEIAARLGGPALSTILEWFREAKAARSENIRDREYTDKRVES